MFTIEHPLTGELIEVTVDEVIAAKERFLSGVSVTALSPKEIQILGSKLGMRSVEILDSTPMEPPIGFIRRPPLHETIRDMVRSERLRQEAESAGAESFEEADDFDIPDDDELPGTPYETNFEPEIPAPPPPNPAAAAAEAAAGGRGAAGPKRRAGRASGRPCQAPCLNKANHVHL